MLTEQFVSTISGPPIAANTAVSKEIGIYVQTISPAFSTKATFKKSSCPRHGLAVSETHIFAAQDQKAHVHVYSRARGHQEALISFTERVRSIALAGNVLIVGTIEGRLILWEVRCFSLSSLCACFLLAFPTVPPTIDSSPPLSVSSCLGAISLALRILVIRQEPLQLS